MVNFEILSTTKFIKPGQEYTVKFNDSYNFVLNFQKNGKAKITDRKGNFSLMKVVQGPEKSLKLYDETCLNDFKSCEDYHTFFIVTCPKKPQVELKCYDTVVHLFKAYECTFEDNGHLKYLEKNGSAYNYEFEISDISKNWYILRLEDYKTGKMIDFDKFAKTFKVSKEDSAKSKNRVKVYMVKTGEDLDVTLDEEMDSFEDYASMKSSKNLHSNETITLNDTGVDVPSADYSNDAPIDVFDEGLRVEKVGKTQELDEAKMLIESKDDEIERLQLELAISNDQHNAKDKALKEANDKIREVQIQLDELYTLEKASKQSHLEIAADNERLLNKVQDAEAEITNLLTQLNICRIQLQENEATYEIKLAKLQEANDELKFDIEVITKELEGHKVLAKLSELEQRIVADQSYLEIYEENMRLEDIISNLQHELSNTQILMKEKESAFELKLHHLQLQYDTSETKLSNTLALMKRKEESFNMEITKYQHEIYTCDEELEAVITQWKKNDIVIDLIASNLEKQLQAMVDKNDKEILELKAEMETSEC